MTRPGSAAAIIVVLLAAAVPARAQYREASPYLHTVQELVLTDGSRAYGTVEVENATEILFRTTTGAALITPRNRVLSLRPVVGRTIKGEFRREDPNNTRLLFGPTGRSLRKGEVYLGVYEVIVPFVQVGVTDRVSIGGGSPLIFGIENSERPYWITPKVQVLSHRGTEVAVGLMHGFAGDNRAGIAYGVMTRELPSGAFTIGAGMGYTSDGDRGGVLMIGGEAPVRRNIKWVTENYVWNSTIVTSGGFRFFGERLSADLALGFVVHRGDPVVPFPVVNFVYHF